MGKGRLPDLSKVEWDLMNHIWRCRNVTVSNVHGHFSEERGWSHNTVKTMMQRLVKKGYLACDDSQKAHIYEPVVPRSRVLKETLGETLDRILDDGFGPLVAYAAERKDLSDKDIKQLRQMLAGEAEEDG